MFTCPLPIMENDFFLCSTVWSFFFRGYQTEKFNVPTEFDRFVYSFVCNKSQLLLINDFDYSLFNIQQSQARSQKNREFFFAQLLYTLYFNIEIVKRTKKKWRRIIKHAGIFVVIAQHSNLTYIRAIVQLLLIFSSWNRTPHVDLYKLNVCRTLYTVQTQHTVWKLS